MKFGKYTNLFISNEFLLIHNTLENKLFRTSDDKLKAVLEEIYYDNKGIESISNNKDFADVIESLKDGLFIIDDDYNETNIANLRFSERAITNKTLGLTILPTRQCNFRCPYCYEEHENRVMADHMYDDILQFINDYVKKNGTQLVNISWFGGEPMLEYENICKFMEKLRDTLVSDVLLTGSMTTNGYLLTSERFEKLLSYNVRHYQITVDGPKEFHDSTRFLAGGKGTWDVIMANLFAIKRNKSNFEIVIRTNISPELVEHLEEWYRYLSNNFINDKRFQFHPEAIRDLGGADNSLLNNDISLYKKISEFNINLGIDVKKTYNFYSPFSMICYASDRNAFVIDYDGKIKKCSVALDNDYNTVGQIRNKNARFNEEKLSWWTSYPLKEKCYDCKIFPLCYGRKCPNGYCNEEYCDELFEIYKSKILTTIL
ncbi:MAG: radical SAM protein [Oscillospiraceae bacterium]|nr:radical SAM protein [Oscillospiraceae bacterium]